MSLEKIVRINKLSSQDEVRRQDVLKMSPVQRVEALLKMIDNMNPSYKPIEKIVTIRSWK